jgi:hypothetical protein
MSHPSQPPYLLIILDEQYKLCNFLSVPIIFFLIGPDIFLSTLLLNTLNSYFSTPAN